MKVISTCANKKLNNEHVESEGSIHEIGSRKHLVNVAAHLSPLIRKKGLRARRSRRVVWGLN